MEEAENPALKANFAHLRAGKSIEDLRLAMKSKGYDIGTGTLHKMSQGKSGNRLASLKKVADFWGVTVDQLLQEDLGADLAVWPFSLELRDLVSKLNPDEIAALENAMWAHLKEPAPEVVQERLRRAKEAFLRGSQAMNEITDQDKGSTDLVAVPTNSKG